MSRHDMLIDRAMKVAQGSLHKKWFLGAVATRNGQILNYSANRFRNDPWICPEGASTHAEVAAVRPLRRSLLSTWTRSTSPA